MNELATSINQLEVKKEKIAGVIKDFLAMPELTYRVPMPDKDMTISNPEEMKLSELNVKFATTELNRVKEIEAFVKNTNHEVQTGIETLHITSEIITDMLKWTEKLERFLEKYSTEVIDKTTTINDISSNLENVKQGGFEIKNASREQTEAVAQINIKTQHIAQESENILMSSMELGAIVDELKRITISLKKIIST